jgi:protein kinase-like protein
MNEQVESCVKLFRDGTDDWLSSYSRVQVSYIAIPGPETNLSILAARITFGTEIDLPKIKVFSLRDQAVVAAQFQASTKDSIETILNNAVAGKIASPTGVPLEILSPEIGPRGASINTYDIDSSSGAQIRKHLYLDGHTFQDLLQKFNFNPDAISERLQGHNTPFENLQELATSIGIDRYLLERGSSIMVTARSPAKFDAESRYNSHDGAIVQLSLGSLVRPEEVTLGYILKTAGGESTRSNLAIDSNNLISQDDGSKTWRGTVPSDGADDIKLYLTRMQKKLGELDLHYQYVEIDEEESRPPSTQPQSPRPSRRINRGLTFKTPFDTYIASGAPREGGSGFVVPATDEDGQKRAVKYLKPDQVKSGKLKRFRNEMSFCFGVKHENIVRVIDMGSVEIGGQIVPFYVMPFYQRTLRHLIDENIGADIVVPRFLHLLEATSLVHKNDIVHRDIKPENILVDDSSGTLILADFGIAHFAEEHLHTTVETKFGDRLANDRYAAPEQRKKGAAVGPTADIWALGLILNEMFTGTVNVGRDAPTIAEHAEDYGFLDDIVHKMIQNDPQKRYQSASEVRRAIVEASGE